MSEAQAQSAEVTTVSLSEICTEMNIKPQGARIKLRKKLGKKSRGDNFRWVFPIEQKAEIVALLTPKAKADPEDESEGEGEEE